jgi:hypothetical protein
MDVERPPGAHAPWRLPALAFVLVLLGGAILVDRRDAGVAAESAPAPTAAQPAAMPDDGESSTWFCAANTAGAPDTDTGAAPEHTVLVANGSSEARRVDLTVHVPNGDPLTKSFTVDGRARLDVALHELVPGSFASATVEADGGAVTVAHRLEGPAGSATSLCASSASRRWYFPAGSMAGPGTALYTLYNPFDQQVFVDISFQVEDDAGRQAVRAPARLKSLVIPGRRAVTVDVTADVAGRRQFATRIEAHDAGARFVAEQVLSQNATPTQPRSLSVVLGGSTPRPAWVFADGRSLDATASTVFVVYNPGAEAVEVELRLRMDLVTAAVEPFRATIPPGAYQTIPIDGDRVTRSVGYWALAVARTPGSFVVERVVQAKALPSPGATAAASSAGGDAPTTTTTRPREGRSAAPAVTRSTSLPPETGLPGIAVVTPSVIDVGGVYYTMGSPALAAEWFVAPASVAAGEAGLVAVTNFEDHAVTLWVTTMANGRETAVSGYHAVTLEAGARTTIDLADPGLEGKDQARVLRVRADGAVAVESVLAVGTPAGLSSMPGVPVRDGLAAPTSSMLALSVPPPLPEMGTPPPTGETHAPDDTVHEEHGDDDHDTPVVPTTLRRG